jgi:hypothetical protein
MYRPPLQIFQKMSEELSKALYTSYEAAKILNLHEHIFNLRGKDPQTWEAFSELMTGTMREMSIVGIASMHSGCPLFFLRRITECLKKELDLKSVTKGLSKSAQDLVGQGGGNRDLMRLLMDGMDGVSQGFSPGEKAYYKTVSDRGVTEMAKRRFPAQAKAPHHMWLRWEGVTPLDTEFQGVGKDGPPAPYDPPTSPRKRKRADGDGDDDDGDGDGDGAGGEAKEDMNE